jgi:hypothetical protein
MEGCRGASDTVTVPSARQQQASNEYGENSHARARTHHIKQAFLFHHTHTQKLPKLQTTVTGKKAVRGRTFCFQNTKINMNNLKITPI